MVGERDLVSVEHDGACRYLRGAGVEHQGGAVPERPDGAGQHTHLRINPAGGRERAGPREQVPAGQVLLLDTGQVDRHPAARSGDLDLAVVLLEAADADPAPAGQGLQLLPHLQRAINQGAGHHRAEAADGEDAIDRQPRPAEVGARLGRVEEGIQLRFQRFQAAAGER